MLREAMAVRASSNSKDSVRRLNVGCGRTFHPEWTNVDLESVDPQVLKHDIRQGLPFDDDTFDVVYHSHVLEHLAPEDGERLIAECYRVLKPGGVLRIVVPDLEQIARLYLEMHDLAWQGDEQAAVDYNWIKLELLDQLVREFSGGRMGRYMSNPEIQNSDFVRSRVGDEFWICRRPDRRDSQTNAPLSWGSRIWAAVESWRKTAALTLVRWLLGRNAASAVQEGLFRSQGEVHRWMYDRYSLKQIAQSAGFEQFEVCTADSSNIDDFERFHLDVAGASIRKPDSLFVECCKPRVAQVNEKVA